jgi:hypothetical protein
MGGKTLDSKIVKSIDIHTRLRALFFPTNNSAKYVRGQLTFQYFSANLFLEHLKRKREQ